MMSGQLRAVAVVVAVAAIVFVVYRHEHHAYRSDMGGLPVEVLVATRSIQKGTSGDIIRKSPGYYELAVLPSGKVESGAITDTSTLTGKSAVKDIPTGQQLTTADFGPPNRTSRRLSGCYRSRRRTHVLRPTWGPRSRNPPTALAVLLRTAQEPNRYGGS